MGQQGRSEARMRLWHNAASPFARKVRIVARETGLGALVDEVQTLVNPAKPNADLAKENPLVKIPALATPDLGTLYDSAVICEYLDSLNGEAPLFPKAGPERWRALRLQSLGDGILDAAVLLRYEGALRPEALRWADWVSGQWSKVRGGLNELERDCPTWDGRFGIGQITAACVLGYLDFRFPGENWRQPHPALAAWFAKISIRPSVKETVPA